MQSKTADTSKRAVAVSLFSRKIGNTTYPVSVSFSQKSGESIADRILRFVASEANRQSPAPNFQ